MRKPTKRVTAGGVAIGGGAPVSVQSMLNAPAHDIAANICQAEELCRERGGRLAVIHSAQELEEVTALAEAQGIEFLWLGFSRVDGEIRWLDGSEGYFVWSEGEPSVTDTDGTREDYGLLWHTDAGWFYNDSRNDPAADYPDIYGGRLGFVCETAA